MAKDLTVILEDRPGALAQLGEALGNAGVNIEGVCGVSSAGKAEFHVLVEDAAGARRALEDAGLEVSGERDVVVVDVEDRPGVVGELARRAADRGVNLQVVYVGTNNRVVFGGDDVETLRSALGA